MRIVYATCAVDYSGRLDAHLEPAKRALMIKADGAVLVHADGGSYKPLNWMSPPCTMTVDEPSDEERESGVSEVWRVDHDKTDDALLIQIYEIHDEMTLDLGQEPGLFKDGVEDHLQKLLSEQTDILGKDVRLIRREYPTAIGPVDLLVKDGSGHIAVEVKRRGEIDGVEQLDNVIVIGASNREDMIDPAILRPGRLDVKIRIERPTRAGSVDILQKYLTPDLPIHDDELAAHGSADAAVVAMAKATVDELSTHTEDNEFIEVTYADGSKEVLYISDFVSGAMLAAIVDRAKKRAIKDLLATGERGIRERHLLDALSEEARENEDLTQMTNPDEWARVHGRGSGKRVTYVKPLVKQKVFDDGVQAAGTGSAAGTATAQSGTAPAQHTSSVGAEPATSEADPAASDESAEREKRPVNEWDNVVRKGLI